MNEMVTKIFNWREHAKQMFKFFPSRSFPLDGLWDRLSELTFGT